MPVQTRASSKAGALSLQPAHHQFHQESPIDDLPAQVHPASHIISSDESKQEAEMNYGMSPAASASKTEEQSPEVGQKLADVFLEGSSKTVKHNKPNPVNQRKQTRQKNTSAAKSSSSDTVHEISLEALPHALNVEAGQESFTTVAEAALVAEKFYKERTVRHSSSPRPSLEVGTTSEKTRKAPALTKLDLKRNPFPETSFPSLEQANKVAELLYQRHGKIGQPADIPEPPADAAGCGEVKFLLEALVRTIISQNVKFTGANEVVIKLINHYKRFKDGPTAGCVDWDRVRREGRKPLEKILSTVGCQVQKSKCIIDLLEEVHQIDMNLRVALDTYGEEAFTYDTFIATQVDGSLQEVLLEKQESHELKQKRKTSQLQKAAATTSEAGHTTSEAEQNLMGQSPRHTDSTDHEPDTSTQPFALSRLGQDMVENTAAVLRSGHRILTMDYVHAWPTDKVFAYLQTFNGIAVKTSACATLFCLQRPLIAVDVHVARISKMLAWAPASATEDQAFFYLNLWIPDGLKYALHQLFIVHGKLCLRCQAISKPTTPGWNDTVCCLEHLLSRDLLRPTKKRKMEALNDNDANSTTATDDAEESLSDDTSTFAVPRLNKSESELNINTVRAVPQKPVNSVAQGKAKRLVKNDRKSKAGIQKQSKITDFAMSTTKRSTPARIEKPLGISDLEFVFGASAGKAMITAAKEQNDIH